MNKLKLIVITIIAFLSGCSIVGDYAQGSLSKSSAIYKDMSPEHKAEMSFDTKQNYFSAQLLTSNIEDWQIKVVTYRELAELQIGTSVELTLIAAGETYSEIEQPVLLDVRSQGKLVEYTYQFTTQNQWFWQHYQQALFNFEKPDFNFFLQPNISNHHLNDVSHIEYKFAPDFGFLTLAQLMRNFWAVSDTRWVEFCESNEYRFDKIEACGQVTIVESD